MDKVTAFKKDLAELLEKHNAALDWSCHWSSDTHGITEARLVVNMDQVEYDLTGDQYVDASDLKRELSQ